MTHLFKTTITCKACIENALLEFLSTEERRRKKPIDSETEVFWKTEIDGTYSILLRTNLVEDTTQTGTEEYEPENMPTHEWILSKESKLAAQSLSARLSELPEHQDETVVEHTVSEDESEALLTNFTQYLPVFSGDK